MFFKLFLIVSNKDDLYKFVYVCVHTHTLTHRQQKQVHRSASYCVCVWWGGRGASLYPGIVCQRSHFQKQSQYGLSWPILWASLVAQWLSICMQYTKLRFDPWVGKIPWRREWQPTPAFLPGKSHGQRSLAGYSPWVAKSQTRLRD